MPGRSEGNAPAVLYTAEPLRDGLPICQGAFETRTREWIAPLPRGVFLFRKRIRAYLSYISTSLSRCS